MDTQTKHKLWHVGIHLLAFYTLIFHWDLKLFLVSLVIGQFLLLFGTSLTLHRYCSHRAFVPKNNFIKAFLLYVSTLCSMGSGIQWAIVHRTHHKYNDIVGKDPHPPQQKWKEAIKIWFYFFNFSHVKLSIVQDLAADKMIVFFHRHYFKILISSVIGIFLLSPENFGYYYAVSCMTPLIANGYITVIAHTDWIREHTGGYRNFNSGDTAYNSKLFSWVTMGEAFHNNHHAHPRIWKLSMRKDETDLAAFVIPFIGTPTADAMLIETPPTKAGWPMVTSDQT